MPTNPVLEYNERMKNADIGKRIAFLGLMTAFSLILSYVEVLIPFDPGIPGVKPGLANIAVVLSLVLFGPREALTVGILKAVIMSFLFGNPVMMIYSLAGTLFSLLVMILLYGTGKLRIVTVSCAGGMFHNMGQFLAAYLMMKSPGILSYLPVLLLAGFGMGLLVGTVSALILPGIKKVLRNGEIH